MRGPPSGTVTLLFTDIEGSTRLLDELGPERYRDTLAEHRRVLRAAFERHGGYEVDYEGDAFFVAFQDAAAGVAAALEGQAALAEGPIRVRMGLHTGEPLLDPPKYVGRDVHLAARIMSAGHGRQVLVSRATQERLSDVAARDLGEHRLKDFAEPVWLFQLGEESFPPLKTISNTNLPRPASSFVGRGSEVAELRSLLRGPARLVTLSGPGGSGKTRLAIEAASELVGDFRNGVFWVGLAAVRDPEVVVPNIGSTLGALNGLAAHIEERELLLLLDNLEQVVAAGPELATLIESCPNLKLLVTSRELLRVRGEVEYEVLPLADPDAVELFCARAQLPAGEAVVELCRRLDNMPLALELAAARAKVLSPDQILARLGQRLDLFTGGRDADPRQATLRSTIEWSYDLLGVGEQRLFNRLAVFAGGSTLESAEEVAGADLDTLQSLVEKSLVRQTGDRFWMLETIREYARERLLESREEGLLSRRHAERCLQLAELSGMAHESDMEERYDLVLAELENIRAALEWALEVDPILGMRMMLALEGFWVASATFEGRRWFGELLENPGVPDEMRARALRCNGGLHWIVGDFEDGNRLHEESLSLFRRLGDERGAALVTIRFAVEAQRLGDLERARSLAEESLDYHRRAGFAKGEAEALLILSYVPFQEGRFEESLELADRSAVLAGEVGWPWWESGALTAAAECLLRLGRWDEARERALKALTISNRIKARQWTVFALALLAWAAASTHEPERAGRLWGAIEAEAERGRIGQWEEGEREEYGQHVLAVAGPEFDRGFAHGRALRLDEAVDYALSVDSLG